MPNQNLPDVDFSFATEGDQKAAETPSYAELEQAKDADRARVESQETESSVVKHRTEGPSTNGYPAAIVPAPKEASPADEAEDDTPEDADAAEGKEAKGSSSN